jgi:uncharacterized protein YecA (UPF0149 family)
MNGIIPDDFDWESFIARKDSIKVNDDGQVCISELIPLFVESGRNDPCPCGSGKKFKKCHGQ